MIRLPCSIARRLGFTSKPRRKGERVVMTGSVLLVSRGRRVASRPMREDDLVSLMVWLCCGCWP